MGAGTGNAPDVLGGNAAVTLQMIYCLLGLAVHDLSAGEKGGGFHIDTQLDGFSGQIGRQIAAVADNHLLISKSVSDGRTRTVVNKLEGENRISEVARIISGGEMTENLYNTAKELINNGLTT